MKYPVAERFHAPQGEGLHAGAQFAFIRLVGCSVGKGTCTACDTDFDGMREHLGGGLYTPRELAAWAGGTKHVCLTGGEPLDRDLRPLLDELRQGDTAVHIETSGTVHPAWLDPPRLNPGRPDRQHAVGFNREDPVPRLAWRWLPLWVTVSPKPGWREEMVTDVADEVKVILGGLGDGPGWPTVDDAVRWASAGKLVYVQPRNLLLEVDRERLREALAVVAEHPTLRLSVQLHKFLETR